MENIGMSLFIVQGEKLCEILLIIFRWVFVFGKKYLCRIGSG